MQLCIYAMFKRFVTYVPKFLAHSKAGVIFARQMARRWPRDHAWPTNNERKAGWGRTKRSEDTLALLKALHISGILHAKLIRLVFWSLSISTSQTHKWPYPC